MPPYGDVDKPPPCDVLRLRGQVLKFGMVGLFMSDTLRYVVTPRLQGLSGPHQNRPICTEFFNTHTCTQQSAFRVTAVRWTLVDSLG